ncbi:MAG: flagellar biosynthetic protein FliR [Phycisphaerales bacterium]|nr:flagellar biosynthetic protein FliR [Phycisphaerales bacterium]
MNPEVLQLLPHLPVWVLVMFRLTGIFIIAPIFGSASIPGRIKILWAFVLSLCVYPILVSQPSTLAMIQPVLTGGLSLWTLPAVVALELAIGVVIGYGALIPLVGIQLAGQMADQQVGTGLAGIFNPEMGEEAGGIITEFYFIIAMLFFLCIDGHRAVVATLLQSFQNIPLGGLMIDGQLIELIVGLLASMMEVALRIAAPLLCLVFLETVAMGFLARTVPQMNLLSIGFPLRIVAGVGILIACMPSHSGIISEYLREQLQTMAGYFGGS